MEANVMMSIKIVVQVLLALLPAVRHAIGALPVMTSRGHSLTGASYLAYYATGQATIQIGVQSLPSCSASLGPGGYLAIVNRRTGRAVANTSYTSSGMMNGSQVQTNVSWDLLVHPILDGSYAGTYVCVAGKNESHELYQLNIVATLQSLAPTSADLIVSYSRRLQDVECAARGSTALAASWSMNYSGHTTHTSMDPVTGTYTARAMLLFVSAEVADWADADGNATSAESDVFISAVCTTFYETFTCSPGLVPAVVANCDAVPRSSKTLLTIQITGIGCSGPPLHSNIANASTWTPARIGEVRNTSCPPGYRQVGNISTTACVHVDTWLPLPQCVDINECLSSPCPSTTSVCRNTAGSYLCLCAQALHSGQSATDATAPSDTAVTVPSACSVTLYFASAAGGFALGIITILIIMLPVMNSLHAASIKTLQDAQPLQEEQKVERAQVAADTETSNPAYALMRWIRVSKRKNAYRMSTIECTEVPGVNTMPARPPANVPEDYLSLF